MVGRVLRAEVSFFDKTPVGRIMNVFSKDIGAIDLVLYFLTDTFLLYYSKVVSSLVLVVILVPYLLVALAGFLAILLLVRCKTMRFTNSALQLDLLSRSPVASLLSSILSGLSSLRAFGRQSLFLDRFLGLL